MIYLKTKIKINRLKKKSVSKFIQFANVGDIIEIKTEFKGNTRPKYSRNSNTPIELICYNTNTGETFSDTISKITNILNDCTEYEEVA